MSRSVLEHGTIGGMETHGRLLARGLARLNHEVSVITSAHPLGLQEDEAVGVRLHYLPNAPTGRYSKQFFGDSVRALEEVHGSTPIDIVLSQSAGARGYVTSSALSRLKIPVAAIFHGLATWELRTRWTAAEGILDVIRALYWAAKLTPELLLYDRTFLRMDGFIAVSEEIAGALKSRYRSMAERVFCVPNGVDTNSFCPDPAAGSRLRRELEVSEDQVIVLMAGRLVKEKGYHLGLEALARLTGLRESVMCLVVGTGPAEEQLRTLTDSLGLAERVRFLGSVSQEHMRYYYNASDVFLMPTLCWESFALTLAEAMACGVPVVSHRLGGTPTVVRDGRTGFLIEPGSSKALCDRLTRLIGDPQLRQRMGNAAREDVVSRLSDTVMAEKTASILTEIVDRHR